MKYIFILFAILWSFQVSAYTVSGYIKTKEGKPLPYASILVKGTTEGTTANSKGFYSLNITKGTYTLVCQYIGYKTEESTITVTNKNVTTDFILAEQSYHLNDVEVKAGGEDPAYEIIRNTIKKREEYLNEIKKFQCDVYLKGQLQLRNYPKKIFGKKVDFEDGDTSKKKMIFLSETIAKYYVDYPKHAKIEVVSTKVSGSSDGFGFSFPQIFSFYSNIIKIGEGLNPRGFISPISDNALHYYKYKFEGTFYENGKEVNRIKVIPKRKYEPLFSGYISITENDWRIYSTELFLLKEQQMQLLDTLMIHQLYVPLKDKWVIKQQMIYPSGKILGFDFFGSFVQVFSQFDVNPNFKKNLFDNVLLKIYDSANKKPKTYWDSIRPVPLLDEEAIDYIKKDSLEQVKKSPAYLDSLDRKNNKITITKLLLTGLDFSKRKTKESLSIPSVLNAINYNTVEGWLLNFTPTYTKRYEGRKSFQLIADLRYGFENKHFNASVTGKYNFGKKYLSSISIAGGKNVFQINNDAPIKARDNTFATLYYTRNYLKIYKAWFTKISYRTGLGKGFDVFANFQYQDRLQLNNLDKINTWRKINNRTFTPNYPVELGVNSFKSHKASILNFGVRYRPGTKYIELPNRTINIGSKYPVLTASFTYGLKNFINSDVDFSKWDFSISDDINIKLGGLFRYKINMSGFLHANKIYATDYQHIIGNRTAVATPYLNSFQLAPYYAYSNTANFMTTFHAAYHLKGLLTNKIPLLRKWNWFFVFSGSAMYIQPNVQYYEAMFSLENILKIFRVDFVQGFDNNKNRTSGIRISLPTFLMDN